MSLQHNNSERIMASTNLSALVLNNSFNLDSPSCIPGVIPASFIPPAPATSSPVLVRTQTRLLHGQKSTILCSSIKPNLIGKISIECSNTSLKVLENSCGDGCPAQFSHDEVAYGKGTISLTGQYPLNATSGPISCSSIYSGVANMVGNVSYSCTNTGWTKDPASDSCIVRTCTPGVVSYHANVVPTIATNTVYAILDSNCMPFTRIVSANGGTPYDTGNVPGFTASSMMYFFAGRGVTTAVGTARWTLGGHINTSTSSGGPGYTSTALAPK